MVVVRETVAGDWQALRDIRLEALRDAPAAFGSTYEREVLRGEARWRDWISRGGTFLAYLPDLSASEPAGADRRLPGGPGHGGTGLHVRTAARPSLGEVAMSRTLP